MKLVICQVLQKILDEILNLWYTITGGNMKVYAAIDFDGNTLCYAENMDKMAKAVVNIQYITSLNTLIINISIEILSINGT